LHNQYFWRRSRGKWGKALAMLAAVLTIMFMTTISECRAEEAGEEDRNSEEMSELVEYRNPDTGFRVLVEDDAELLTEEERRELAASMEKITAYGNVAFKSVSENSLSAERYARNYYMDRFGTESGTVFLIDMDNRKIWIHSDGAVYKVITGANADTVADNVYRLASSEEYHECAEEAFREIYALLEGEKIARPMKYISNALLALILALLLNFGLVVCFTRLRKPGEAEILSSIHRKFSHTPPNVIHTHQTKVYDPVSSDSGGGSSNSSGGSGGGSGSSGGGGGHSF
jgi:uncharacterized protein